MVVPPMFAACRPPFLSVSLRVLPPVLLLLLPVLSLGGCGSRLSDADLERQQECRGQADRQFDRQNRYLMSERSQTDTPFSSSGMPGDPSRGLDDAYRRDRMVDDCLHDAGTPSPPRS